jgi:hypothetical protein
VVYDLPSNNRGIYFLQLREGSDEKTEKDVFFIAK